MTKGCVRTPPLEQRGESFVVRPLIARKAARAAQNGSGAGASNRPFNEAQISSKCQERF